MADLVANSILIVVVGLGGALGGFVLGYVFGEQVGWVKAYRRVFAVRSKSLESDIT